MFFKVSRFKKENVIFLIYSHEREIERERVVPRILIQLSQTRQINSASLQWSYHYNYLRYEEDD